jgi:hypothetical protein
MSDDLQNEKRNEKTIQWKCNVRRYQRYLKDRLPLLTLLLKCILHRQPKISFYVHRMRPTIASDRNLPRRKERERERKKERENKK